MLLMTKAIEKTIPALYATEKKKAQDKKVVLKFFLEAFTWFVVEGQPEEQDGDWTFFGYVQNDGAPDCSEWGYFTLNQLKAVRGRFGNVERDMYFTPCKFSEIKRIIR